MKILARPVCWLRGHRLVALTINGHYSGKKWCDRCGAEWWRGRRRR